MKKKLFHTFLFLVIRNMCVQNLRALAQMTMAAEVPCALMIFVGLLLNCTEKSTQNMSAFRTSCACRTSWGGCHAAQRWLLAARQRPPLFLSSRCPVSSPRTPACGWRVGLLLLLLFWGGSVQSLKRAKNWTRPVRFRTIMPTPLGIYTQVTNVTLLLDLAESWN